MCYAQIGGLSVSTFITPLLVPSDLRDVCLDLKLVQWDKPAGPEEEELSTVLAKPLHLLSERQCSFAHSF